MFLPVKTAQPDVFFVDKNKTIEKKNGEKKEEAQNEGEKKTKFMTITTNINTGRSITGEAECLACV